MTLEEANKLPHGVYEIHWAAGHRGRSRKPSLGSVGSLHNGDRWIAPCNWVGEKSITLDASHWESIKKVVLIKAKEY